MSRPVDLGQICLCVNAADVDETAAFYERLGFRSTGLDAPKIRRSVAHGSTILTFMSFLERPLINYRGASIHALITELAARGFEILNLDQSAQLLMLDENGEPLPDNECGAFSIIDPDGNEMFFNTHPPERAPYKDQNWLSDPILAVEIARVRDEGIGLGDLLMCLDIKDLAASVRFYEELGLDVLHSTADSTTLGSLHPHGLQNPTAFPIRLHQAPVADARFSFRCDDAETVAASIRRLGINVVATRDGPAFVDPDDRRVVLMPADASS
ncbi:MAG: VOC family protein [Myxococcota bacterium]